MTRPRYLSARGELILLVPDAPGERLVECYRVVCFDRRGQWTSMSEPMPRPAAAARRRELFALHRRLARERAARGRKT